MCLSSVADVIVGGRWGQQAAVESGRTCGTRTHVVAVVLETMVAEPCEHGSPMAAHSRRLAAGSGRDLEAIFGWR